MKYVKKQIKLFLANTLFKEEYKKGIFLKQRVRCQFKSIICLINELKELKEERIKRAIVELELKNVRKHNAKLVQRKKKSVRKKHRV